MIRPVTSTRASLSSTALRHGLIAGVALLAPTVGNAITWGGPGGGTDWNVPANWAGSALPVGTFARIDTSTAPIATITADFTGAPSFITIGQNTGSTGRLDHRAGTGSLAAGNDFQIGRSGGTGTYNLANTGGTGGTLTAFATGSGSFNAPRHFYVGGFSSGAASTGTANVNTTGTLAITGQLLLGNSGGTGTVNIDQGTVTVADLIEIGNGAAGKGSLFISGGTLQKNGTGAVTVGGGLAGNGGTGTLKVTGGTVTTGGVLRVGHNVAAAGATNSTGTFELAGGNVTTAGELWIGNNTGATGTFTFSSGQLTTNNWALIGRKDNANAGAGGTGTVTMTGGTWTKTGESNFVIGDTGTGVMTMSGGTVTVAPNTVANRGITWVGNRNNANGTLTIQGAADFSSPRFVLGVEVDTTGTVNFKGGTVRTSSITGGFGNSTVLFDGTQFVATGNSTEFIDFLLNAEVGAGGLKVDTAGFSLSATQPLTGTGDITKTGAGMLALTGLGTHVGNSNVQAGTLMQSTANADGGNVTVATGSTYGVVQDLNSGSLSKGAVTFGSGGVSYRADFGNSFGNPTAAGLDVTGTLTLNGPVTVNVADDQPVVGTIPLIKYAMPRAGGGSFVLGQLPLGATGSLSDNGNGLVSLEITSVKFPVWKGSTNGTWDQTTENWEDRDTSDPIAYVDPLPVLFDDSATGTTEILLGTTVAPGAVRFDIFEKEYALTGTGKITGPTGLTKDGTANLTISTANDFTGPVAINGGTVIVNSLSPTGSPGALGAGTSPIVFFGGGLNHTGTASVTNRPLAIDSPGTTLATASSLTFSGPVTSNAGSFVKDGTGTLAFTHNGPVVLGTTGGGFVHAGTLALRGTGAQNVSITGELWVADQENRPADLVLENTTLSTTNWLAIGRGNGNDGVTRLTATGSTLNTVNFSTGFNAGLTNNASEAIVELTNTTWNNNGLTYLAESTGSDASFTLNGNSRYNITSNFLVARFGGTTGAVTLNGSSSINKTGGYTSIGTEGTGKLTLKDSATFNSPAGDFNIADVGVSVGTLELLGTGGANVSNVYIGKNSSTTGIYRQTGGSFQSTSFIYFASGTGSTGTGDIAGGTFTAASVIHIGGAGSATVGISGGAVVTANGDGVLVGGVNGGTGVLNFGNGTIVAKRLYEEGGASSTVNFNGGTLRALAGANATFLGPIDNAVLQANGVTIDTSGQNLSATANLGGTGGLTKTGAGTLTLSGTISYTGATTVSAGTLSVPSASLSNTGAVNIASGAVLHLPHGQVDQVATLTVAGSPVPAGTYGATQLPGVITGTGSLQVQGTGGGSPFSTWINGFTSIPVEDRDAGDDPDGDGLTNAMEFALGSTPNSAASRPKIYTFIQDSEADTDTLKELLMTILVRSNTPAFQGSPSPTATHDGYTYKIQGSTNLGGFTTAIVKPVNVVAPSVPAPAGYEYRTFSLSDSNGTPSRGFMRVDITP